MHHKETLVYVVLGVTMLISGLIQLYLIRSEYETRKIEFQREVSQVLQETIAEANGWRADRVNEYFRMMLLDTSYVSLDSGLNAEGFRQLTLIDRKRGEKTVSIVAREEKESQLSYFELLMTRNRENLLNNEVIYWQQDLGEELIRLLNEETVSVEEIDSLFTVHLESHQITNPHTLFLSDSPPATEGIYSDSAVLAFFYTKKTYQAVFTDPFFTLIQRSRGVMLWGLVSMAALALSFFLMVRLFKRERRLVLLKDSLIDHVAHEIFTPVTTLQLSLERVSKQLVQNDLDAHYVNIASTQVNRLSGLSHMLQSTLEMESNAKDELTDWNEFSESVMNAQSKQDLSLSIQSQEKGHPQLAIPRHYLQVVIDHLLENSLKYREAPLSQVTIRSTVKGKTMHLDYQDNGWGIPEHVQAMIFEKFYRYIAPGSVDAGGLGLGLYTVKAILSHFGGQIRLGKSSSNGTQFLISIPLGHEN